MRLHIRHIFAFVFCCLLATSSAWAWPLDSQWLSVSKGGQPIHDPQTDAGGSRNVVPDSGSLAAAYLFNDGVNIYFRFRLDADPTGTGGQGLLEPYGWGFEIDTDQNADDYEWLMMCDGITSPEIVALRENTEKSHLGDPSDTAERIVAQYPLAGNYRISAADTCYDSQKNPTGVCNAQYDYRDYFLDYKIPYSVFKSATGITDQTIIRFFVGTSSAANNLTENGADLVAGSDLYSMATDFVTPFGTLPTSTTFYDGTVRFVDDLNGAYDRSVAATNATLYLRVDDLDLNSQSNPSETIVVTVTSPTGDRERVTLYATGVQGKYTGSLPTSDTANSAGTLYILNGQSATVTYIDAITANRSQSVSRTDTIFLTATGTDLAVSKSVDIVAPLEGQTVTFTIRVTNNGPSTVTSLTIHDQWLASGDLAYLSHTASAGTTYNSGTGDWSITSNLAVGASATLTLRATVNAGTSGHTVTNTASLTASTPSDGYSANNSASSTLKIGGTDLRVTKSVDQPLPVEGETITYSVRVLNLGPSAASGVQVTDLLPAGLTYISHTAGQNYNAGSGIWDVGSLAVGAGALLKITATVNGGTTGQTITNTATRTAGNQPDTNPANDSASAAIRVEFVDLKLTKQVRRYAPTTTSFGDSVAANIGNTVEFRVEARNNGPHDASGIVVTDTLPLGLTYVAGSASVTHGSFNSATGIWTLGNLADTATATLLLRATVNAGTAGQTLTNQARITGRDQPDSTPGDETGFASVAVNGTDLRITKSVSNATPNPGNSITWTVTVTNDGPNQATSVTASDRLPTGVTRTNHTVNPGQANSWSATGGNPSWIWTIGTLNVNASVTLTIDTTVDAGTTGQTIVNDAFITGADQADPNDGNNVASATIYVGGTNLNIVKTVDDNTPNVGQQIAYTLTVRNQSVSNSATGVVVHDLLPPEVRYDSHSTASGSYTTATGLWSIGTLAAGASATLTINATVLNEDNRLTITNTATVDADQADQDPTDNTATVDIHVNATDLAVSKVASNATPYEGASFFYTVTVNNSGGSVASGIEIEDVLPGGLTYLSHSASQGAYTAGLWTVGTLAGNASATLTITVRANAGTAGTPIVNSASVYAVDQIDTNSANNSASVSVTPAVAPPIPLFTMVKSAQVVSDGGFAIPGAEILYEIVVINAGIGSPTADSTVILDPIDSKSALVVTGTPVAISNGTPPSGLNALVFNDLADLTDDVAFCNLASLAACNLPGGWNYVPTADGNGVDGSVTYLRVNPKGTFSAAGMAGNPNFTLSFKVKIK